MKKDEFETALLDLWMTTAIPLTEVNLRYHTGVPRRRMHKWLDQMVQDGHLDIDSDNDGALTYHVPGARRPVDGPRTFAERNHVRSLTRQVKSSVARGREPGTLERLRSQYTAGTALSIASDARRELEKGPGPGKKSLILSSALSFFFGPLGWLYAGSWREAIPASAAFLLVSYLLPTFLLLPLAGIALPVSGIAGLVYAWQYNRHGKRDRILGDDDA